MESKTPSDITVARLYLELESLQLTASHKERGAIARTRLASSLTTVADHLVTGAWGTGPCSVPIPRVIQRGKELTVVPITRALVQGLAGGS